MKRNLLSCRFEKNLIETVNFATPRFSSRGLWTRSRGCRDEETAKLLEHLCVGDQLVVAGPDDVGGVSDDVDRRHQLLTHRPEVELRMRQHRQKARSLLDRLRRRRRRRSFQGFPTILNLDRLWTKNSCNILLTTSHGWIYENTTLNFNRNFVILFAIASSNLAARLNLLWNIEDLLKCKSEVTYPEARRDFPGPWCRSNGARSPPIELPLNYTGKSSPSVTSWFQVAQFLKSYPKSSPRHFYTKKEELFIVLKY